MLILAPNAVTTSVYLTVHPIAAMRTVQLVGQIRLDVILVTPCMGLGLWITVISVWMLIVRIARRIIWSVQRVEEGLFWTVWRKGVVLRIVSCARALPLNVIFAMTVSDWNQMGRVRPVVMQIVLNVTDRLQFAISVIPLMSWTQGDNTAALQIARTARLRLQTAPAANPVTDSMEPLVKPARLLIAIPVTQPIQIAQPAKQTIT